jgi:hypothetical protein
MNSHRKLLVLALNELLERKLVSLDDPGNGADGSGHLSVLLAGSPSMITWNDISGGEQRLSVWWKYDHSRHPQANLEGNARETFSGSSPLAKSQHYPKFVGVTASCWVERRTGKWLQGRGRENLFDVYTRRNELAALEALPDPIPMGYKAEGKFFR